MITPSLCLLALLPTNWVVYWAGGPGVDFTDIPAAVAAAQTGDTIFVFPGVYTAFSTTGKALTIVGTGTHAAGTRIATANAAATSPNRGVSVDAVPAGLQFVLMDLAISMPSSSEETALRVLSSSVVTLSNVIATGSGSNGAGMTIGTGSTVHASHCVFTGGLGPGGVGYGGSGAPGATVAAGAFFAADASNIVGGVGGGGYNCGLSDCYGIGGHGGVGLSVSGRATLARTSCHGGSWTTGSGSGGLAPIPGTGSPAIAVSGTVPGAFARIAGNATTVIARSGGASAITGPAIVHGTVTVTGAAPGTTFGAPELPYVSVTGTIVAVGKSELQAAQPTTLTLSAALPGAPFLFAMDFVPDFSTALAPVVLGELLVPYPPTFLFDGVLDAQGTFTVTFVPFNDVPYLCDVPLYSQLAVVDVVGGEYRASNGCIALFRN